MKRRLSLLLAAGTVLLCCPGHANADDALYVQPFRAKLFAKPLISSDVLGSVDSGFRFVATGSEGRWVSFEFKGRKVYILQVQTAKAPPPGKDFSQATEAAPRLTARSRASSASSVVAGVKGLTYEDRARVTRGEQSDFDSLEKVEALRIPADELRVFQLEGGKR